MKRTVWLVLLVTLLCGTWLRVNDIAQIPPGLYHDEAYSGLDALGIVRSVGIPIFLEGNGGREPFFIYLHALALALWGSSAFALRLAAAMVAILTLPVFFVLARSINANHRYREEIALVATAGLAVSYWHLNFSRVGWRTISLPLFACLAVYFLWRSNRTIGQSRNALLAGASLGASLYTYLSARFLPIVFVSFWLAQAAALWSARAAFASACAMRLRTMALVVLAAGTVFAPLGIYFALHPPAFFFRVGDVALAQDSGVVRVVLDNVGRVAQMFFSSGDPEWRHGIARRAVLDWATGLPFLLGGVWAFKHRREPSAWLVSLWLVVMLLPTILSEGAPDLQRAIGALPALYLFIAWGYALAVDVSARLWHRLDSRFVWRMVIVLVLLGGGGISYRDYVLVWAQDRHAYYDFDGNWVDLARWMTARPENLVVPMELYANPTIQFLISPRFSSVRSAQDLSPSERDQIAGEPASVLQTSEDSRGTFVLLRRNAAILLMSPSSVGSWVPPSQFQDWRDRWGRTAAQYGPLSAAAMQALVRPASFVSVRADFDGRLDLVGYALDPKVIAGRDYGITLYWSGDVRIQQGIKVFAHLVDLGGHVWAGVDEPLLDEASPSFWPQGSAIPDYHSFLIPREIPPGKYQLEIGLFQPSLDARLRLSVNEERVSDDRLLLTPLKVAVPSIPVPTPKYPLTGQFANGITLQGFDLPATIRPNEPISLTLYWTSQYSLDTDYTVFVHLLDSQSRIVAQADHQPLEGKYPTTIWDSGEQIVDQTSLVPPPDANNIPLRIGIGLYDLKTGGRVPMVGSDGPLFDMIVSDFPPIIQ